jgi:CNT family concentrative nucleoside transporter
VINEFVAYRQFAEVAATEFSPRSRLIMLYAMSGFANIASLGIMIGGIGSMVPERRVEVIRLGPLAIIGGTLATLSTGAVIGLLEI